MLLFTIVYYFVPMKMFLSASYMGMGYVDAQNSNQA
jgi:hypothetical protein